MNTRNLSCLAIGFGLLLSYATPSHADNVALFVNGIYVDVDADSPGEAEALNHESDIPTFGHAVTSFTSIDPTDLANTLAGQDTLVIPELEGDGPVSRGSSLGDDLGMAGRDAIRTFVEAGGNLIVAYGGQDERELVNDIFGFSLDADECVRETLDPNRGCRGGGGGSAYLITGDVMGNTFEGGPPVLADLSATDSVAEGTLPAGSLSMYNDVDQSVAAVMPAGGGWVIVLGWDWYQGMGDRGSDGSAEQFADWNDVLDRAIRFPNRPSVGALAVPVSPFALSAFGLLLLSAGFLVLRRF